MVENFGLEWDGLEDGIVTAEGKFLPAMAAAWSEEGESWGFCLACENRIEMIVGVHPDVINVGLYCGPAEDALNRSVWIKHVVRGKIEELQLSSFGPDDSQNLVAALFDSAQWDLHSAAELLDLWRRIGEMPVRA